MMTDIEKLVTSARRYCMQNFAFWAHKYSKEMSGRNNPYSDNDYNLFPRYNVIKAIQQGVETLVGKNFDSFEGCKQALANIGRDSHSIFTIDSNDDLHLLGESGRGKGTTGGKNPIERKAINEEREKFIAFVNSRTTENISGVDPLPYRRRLTDGEMSSVRKQFLDRWGYDGGCWNPLEDKSAQNNLFLMKHLLTETDRGKILNYLILNSKNRIYEITEDRIDYEIEFDSFDIDLYETIIADSSFEWVVYGSHEDTITFGGVALIEFIKSLFADRQEKLNKWNPNW